MTGQEFRDHRKQLGLSQAELAPLFGRSRDMIGLWERTKPDDLGARYMAALIATGWRPHDWPE